MYLDNLERLKIIDFPSNVKIANTDIYKPLEEYSEIKETLEQQLPEVASGKLIISSLMLRIMEKNSLKFASKMLRIEYVNFQKAKT